MEDKGFLKDSFDNFKSSSERPDLDWSVIGQGIIDGVEAKEKKKKRPVLFWWFGGVFLIASLLYFTFGSDHLSSAKVDLLALKHENTQLKQDKKIENRSKLKIQSSTEEEALKSTFPAQPQIKVSDALVKKDQKDIPSKFGSESISKTQTESKITSQIKEAEKKSLSKLPLATESDWSQSTNQISIVSNENRTWVKEKLKELYKDEYAVPEISSIAVIVRDSTFVYQLPFKKNKQIRLVKESEVSIPDFVEYDQVEEYNRDFIQSISFHTGVNTYSLEEQFNQADDQAGLDAILEYKVQKNNGLYFGTGIWYSQGNIKASFTKVDTGLLYRPGSIDTIFSFNGVQGSVSQTDSVPGVTTRQFQNHNTLRSVSLPLIIGFEEKISQFGVFGEVGLAVNLRTEISGEFVDEELGVRTISQRHSNLSFDPFIGIGVNYSITSHWNILMTGRWRSNALKAEDEVWANERFSTYHLTLGVGYRW